MDNKLQNLHTLGYLAGNWLAFRRPALIANPQARPGDLLAWCWSEVASLLASADMIATASDTIEPSEFAAIFVHRLRPLESFLEYAVNQMAAGTPWGPESEPVPTSQVSPAAKPGDACRGSADDGGDSMGASDDVPALDNADLAPCALDLGQIETKSHFILFRLMMLQELARLARESLPTGTDSNVPLSLLSGMQAMLSDDTATMHQLSESVSAMVAQSKVGV